MEFARQWRVNCGQLALDLPTEETGRCVPLSPPPRCSTVKTADGTKLTGESEIRTRWAGNFEELYRVDHPDREFLEDVDAVRDANA